MSSSQIHTEVLRNIGKTIGHIKTDTFEMNFLSTKLNKWDTDSNYMHILEQKQNDIIHKNMVIETENEHLEKMYIRQVPILYFITEYMF